jgi:hypothetical protein
VTCVASEGRAGGDGRQAREPDAVGDPACGAVPDQERPEEDGAGGEAAAAAKTAGETTPAGPRAGLVVRHQLTLADVDDGVVAERVHHRDVTVRVAVEPVG